MERMTVRKPDRPLAVELLDATYEIDLDNELQKAFATACHDVASARRGLEAELTQINDAAVSALRQLRAGSRPNPLGPIPTVAVASTTSYAARYDTEIAHALDLLRLCGLQPVATAPDGSGDTTP